MTLVRLIPPMFHLVPGLGAAGNRPIAASRPRKTSNEADYMNICMVLDAAFFILLGSYFCGTTLTFPSSTGPCCMVRGQSREGWSRFLVRWIINEMNFGQFHYL